MIQPGQVLGLVGNTGNSSEPHLHFHVMDAAGGPSNLVADGLPYVFDPSGSTAASRDWTRAPSPRSGTSARGAHGPVPLDRRRDHTVGVMELRHLRYFVAVAEERHFGRAAERLHIAQPPLSQQIRRFEDELGEPLLYRTTRSVELSPAGAVLLERAREILAAVDSAIEDARRAARGEYGRLAIGFTGSSTYEMLPSLAVALRRGLPGVVLDLRGELLTPAQVEAAARRHARSRSVAPAGARARPRRRGAAVGAVIAVLPESHRLAAADAVPLDELANEPFVTYRRISARCCTMRSRTRAPRTASSRSPRTRCPRPRRS